MNVDMRGFVMVIVGRYVEVIMADSNIAQNGCRPHVVQRAVRLPSCMRTFRVPSIMPHGQRQRACIAQGGMARAPVPYAAQLMSSSVAADR